MVAKRGLKELFGHERREQHVAELHDRRDVRPRRKNLLGLLAHESPFQALSVGDECQVRAVQAAHIDGAGHVRRELRTLNEDTELGIGTLESRIR